MKNWTSLFLLGLVATAALFTGCKDDEAEKLVLPGNRIVKVQVVHPTLGTGPNFLVRGYYTQEALDAGRPDVSRSTDINGDVILPGFSPGLAFVECIIANNPNYFDRDTINVPQTTDTTRVTLRPQ